MIFIYTVTEDKWMYLRNYFLLKLRIIKTFVPKSCNRVTEKSTKFFTYTQDVAARLYVNLVQDCTNIKESDYIWCEDNIQYLQIAFFNSTERINFCLRLIYHKINDEKPKNWYAHNIPGNDPPSLYTHKRSCYLMLTHKFIHETNKS